MSSIQDLLQKLKALEESTGDEKFDKMMGGITSQSHLEPNEVAHFKKYDEMITQLGQLGKIILSKPDLWQKYQECGNTGDWEWVYHLIQRYTGATQQEILDLSDIIDEFGTRGSGMVEFAYAVDEGNFDEDFVRPWHEYKLSFNTMEEETSEVGVDTSVNTSGGAGASDESMAECPEEGNVQLSMQDLIQLVKSLQQGGKPGHGNSQQLFGDSVEEEFANAQADAPDTEIMPVSAVLPTGDDLASKGKERPKVNGGGNPMESHLAELYAQVKERHIAELSKGTLASYTKKAAADLNDKAYLSGHAYGKGKGDINREKKAFSRQAGIEKAVDKMSLKEANQMARALRK